MTVRTASSATTRRRATIRAVALPAEHGGWGFLLEPILLGLLVAFSWRGVALGLAALFVFLMHQPMKLALKDLLKRRTIPRTALAIRFALGYGVLALIFFLLATVGSDLVFIIPLMMAVPLAAVQAYSDVRNQSRSLIAELSGSLALGATAASIALLDEWSLNDSLILWGLTGLRTIPSIYYVRARLRLGRNKDADLLSVAFSHIASLVLGLILVLETPDPWITILALIALAARAGKGLSAYRKPMKAKEVGFHELAYGVAYVVTIAIAW